MSEEFVVLHSAPTLAGIKTGNLFSVNFKSKGELNNILGQFNRQLTDKGIRIISLMEQENRALVYIYRPDSLRRDFDNASLQEILSQLEYPITNPSACIIKLAERIKECKGFPHEIGLFLGYPPEDVKGFIENQAQNYKCSGIWKVYGDEKEAVRRFALYKKCTEVYCNRMKKGSSLYSLAVAING